MDRRHSGAEQVTLEPGVLSPVGADEWAARISLLQTDGVRVDAMTLSPHSFRCGPGAVGFRSSLVVAWVREGRIDGTSGGAAFAVLPGQALLWDTRHPLETCIDDDLRLLRVIVDLVDLPARMALEPPRRAAVLQDTPVVRSTMAFAGTLLQESRRNEPGADDLIVVHALVALMAGLVAELERQQRGTPCETLDRRAAIEAHIASHLADPALGPATVSRDFGISVRSVHAAFTGSGTTIAATIRQQRVAAVQQSLHGRATLPRMAELAAQHGFHDTSQLSRTFRVAAGMPVREWWAQHRG